MNYLYYCQKSDFVRSPWPLTPTTCHVKKSLLRCWNTPLESCYQVINSWPTQLHPPLTFAWPLCEQVLVLSLWSGSGHHTGQSSLHPRWLLCRFSGEVLDAQLIIPGLQGTQWTRPIGCWGRGDKSEMKWHHDNMKVWRRESTHHSLLYQARMKFSSVASTKASWSFALVWHEPAHWYDDVSYDFFCVYNIEQTTNNNNLFSAMVCTWDSLYLVIGVAVGLYRTLAACWCFRGADSCP